MCAYVSRIARQVTRATNCNNKESDARKSDWATNIQRSGEPNYIRIKPTGRLHQLWLIDSPRHPLILPHPTQHSTQTLFRYPFSNPSNANHLSSFAPTTCSANVMFAAEKEKKRKEEAVTRTSSTNPHVVRIRCER